MKRRIVSRTDTSAHTLQLVTGHSKGDPAISVCDPVSVLPPLASLHCNPIIADREEVVITLTRLDPNEISFLTSSQNSKSPEKLREEQELCHAGKHPIQHPRLSVMLPPFSKKRNRTSHRLDVNCPTSDSLSSLQSELSEIDLNKKHVTVKLILSLFKFRYFIF